MKSCTVTLRNGQSTHLENVFIRGSKIRYFILPDMLKNAPMFANHFCPPFQHLLSERLTSLGIMGEPRVPPLNPTETIVL